MPKAIIAKLNSSGGGVIVDSPQLVWPKLIFNRTHVVPYVLDAVGEKLAFIFQVPKTGSITKLGFVVSAFTSADTSDVRLETVDATTGNPTGTLAGTNTNASLAVSSTGFKEVTLTAPYSATMGETLAVVVSNGTGGNYSIATVNPLEQNTFPYISFFTASWVKQTKIGSFTIGYSDGSYPQILNTIPTNGTGSVALNTGTTPDEIGIKFTAPYDMRAVGAMFNLSTVNDFKICLYNSVDTVLAETTIDKDIISSGPDNVGHSFFAGAVTLNGGEVYRLVYKPTTASGINTVLFDYANANIKASAGMQLVSRTQRTDAGAWTDDDTDVISIGLVVNGLLG